MKISKATCYIATILLTACQPNGQKDSTITTLKGSLTYLQRIALTSNASAHIKLIDQHQEIIAEQTISPAGQVPIPFKLIYSPNQINPQHTYNIQAEIRESSQLHFITSEPVNIDLNTPPQSLNIRLNLTR